MPQSTITGDTGNLATITFATGITAALKVRSIDPSEETLGRIDTSDLGTTVLRTFIAEDLADAPELSIEWIWDTFHVPPYPGLQLGNVTVTYPTRTGETTPATRVAPGYVSSVKHPALRNNELQLGTMKIQFMDEPAYTKST